MEPAGRGGRGIAPTSRVWPDSVLIEGLLHPLRGYWYDGAGPGHIVRSSRRAVNIQRCERQVGGLQISAGAHELAGVALIGSPLARCPLKLRVQ
jgi:hypothetical protein